MLTEITAWLTFASIDLIHKSDNATVPYPTMHHFVQEMCTHVDISATKWGIVGYLSNALWNSWDGSILWPVKASHITPVAHPFISHPLQWRHNEGYGVSNHRHLDGLFHRLFKCKSKKTSKLRVTGLCDENSPHKRPLTWKMFPFDDVIM